MIIKQIAVGDGLVDYEIAEVGDNDNVNVVSFDKLKVDEGTVIETTTDTTNNTYTVDNDGDGVVDAEKELVTKTEEYVSVESLTVERDQYELAIGDSVIAGVEIAPANASNTVVAWSSSDEDVVTVQNGKIIAVGDGTATICAMSADSSDCYQLITINVHSMNIIKQSHSITLGDNVGVNYYLKLDNNVKNPIMTAWLNESTKREIKGIKQSDGRYKFTYTVAVPEVADTITCSYSATVDGKTVTSTEYTYSVRQYCEFILKTDSFDAKAKAVTANLLNYAAYSQIQFNHNTGNLANASLDELGYHIDLDSSAIDSNAVSTIKDYEGEIKLV